MRGAIAWFRDPGAIGRLDVGERQKWPKTHKPRPDTMDVKEMAYHLWTQPDARRVVLYVVLLQLAFFILVPDAENLPIPESAQAAVSLILLSLLPPILFCFALPIKRAVVGEPMTVREIAKTIVDRAPSVIITSWVTGFVLGVAFMMLILPGLLLLPFVVRAPYEAAIGANPYQAIRRALQSARFAGTMAAAASNFVIDVAISLFLIQAVFGELEMAPFFFDLGSAPHVVEQGVLILTMSSLITVAWVSCVAAFITGDAIMSGVILTENVAELRVGGQPFYLKFISGRLVRWTGTVATIAAIGLLFFGFSKPSMVQTMMGASSVQNLPDESTEIPPFELTSVTGERVSSESLKGKPTVLYFWAPWCKPCSRQIGHLHTIMDEWGDGVNVVSIAMSYENKTQVQNYIKNKGVKYPVLMGDDPSFWPDHKVGAFPTVITLDAEGRVTSRASGVQRSTHLSTALRTNGE